MKLCDCGMEHENGGTLCSSCLEDFVVEGIRPEDWTKDNKCPSDSDAFPSKRYT